MGDRICTVENCGRKGTGCGLCRMHARRFKRTGTTDFRGGPQVLLPCTVVGCDSDGIERGMCHTHYSAAWLKARPFVTCSFDDCEKQARASGWCSMHYARWGKTGTMDDPGPRKRRPLADRFWEKVDKDGPVPDYAPELGPCWIWTGAVSENGYGYIWVADIQCGTTAHRVSYELNVGPIPDGLHIDHLCMVRACVNPTHLEPVTMAENNARAAAHKKKAAEQWL